MNKLVSGRGLEKSDVTDWAQRDPKGDPIDKYHMFRKVGQDHLESFWEASGLLLETFLGTFWAPGRMWSSQNRLQTET